MNRDEYNTKINFHLKSLGTQYDGKKSKIISDDFFNLLNGMDGKTSRKRVELVLNRAERNYNNFAHHNPANEESSTTVFRLVNELLKYS